MYSIVLATVLTAGASAPDLGWRSHSCHGCYGVCYGGCYGVCYGGWATSYHGCGGCWGGCNGCWGCGGCYGGCGGCSGCFGGWASCSGCYGCHGCYGCYGCFGGGAAYSAPAHHSAEHAWPAPAHHGHHHSNAPAIMNGHVSSKGRATVIVKASKDVTVTFNGEATKRSSEQESFQTPELKADQVYAYEVVAEAKREGKTVTSRKRIEVRAGAQAEVDFGDMSAALAQQKAETARITVLLPKDTTLYVDGKEYSAKEKQTFDTPKLTEGKVYYYTLKVEGKSSNNRGAQTRKVNVEAGKDVTVDFRGEPVVSR